MTLAKPERDREMVRLYREGVSRWEIGRRFGVTPHAIYAVLKRLGIEPQNPKLSAGISAAKEGRAERNPLHVDTRTCPCCGVRAVVHGEFGCKRWTP